MWVWVGSGFGVSENAGCAVLEELGVEASGILCVEVQSGQLWGSQMVLDISFLRVNLEGVRDSGVEVLSELGLGVLGGSCWGFLGSQYWGSQ